MRTRFAPAPTGFLHLGHVVNAIHVWGTARAHGGRVVLRIEDHDRERSRPAFEHAILDDLEWLGLEPDEGRSEALRRGPSLHRQSDRQEIYESALAHLRALGLVYACRCSRRDIAALAPRTETGSTDEVGEGQEARYPGTCRDLGLEPGPGLGLRVRMAPGIERFADLRLGLQQQDPSAQCGDLLVRDRRGQWTYQFAVTVDDWQQRITHVIRGEDLLPSTARQIRLARLLGRDEPARFLHHALIYREPGVKLSKANRDTGIRDLRAAGLTREDVLGLAASHLGIVRAGPVTLAQISGWFLAAGDLPSGGSSVDHDTSR